jgi:ubiquitin-protein ligase
MNSTIKRINRDFSELKKKPIPGVGVDVLEGNMMIWHFTIMPPESSKFHNIPFHGNLEFTDKYPMEPPNIYFHHYIESNEGMVVKSERGKFSPCFSLNQDWIPTNHTSWKNENTHGWSISSTMTDYFLQIQYLFFELLGQSNTRNSPLIIRAESLKYSCSICGHNGSDPTKYLPVIKIPIPITQQSSNPIEPLALDPVVESVVESVIERVVEPVVKEYEPICYVSKDRILYSRGNEVYGLLWNVDKEKNIFDTHGSLMSQSIWNRGDDFHISHNKHKVNFFLPMYFSKEHWLVAKEQFKINMTQMILKYDFLDYNNESHPEYKDEYMFMDVLIPIMKSIGMYISKKYCLDTIFLYFFINQTMQQFYDDFLPLVNDKSLNLSLDRDLVLIQKKLNYEFKQLIKTRTDKYKSISPEILDKKQNIYEKPDKGEKIFKILNIEIMNIVYCFLIGKFNCTHDHQETINDQIASDWLNIFNQAKTIKSMTDFFNLFYNTQKWNDTMVDASINQFLGLRDKNGKMIKSANLSRHKKHIQKKAKAKSKATSKAKSPST